MNIALFASDYVGAEVTRMFRERGKAVQCMVLDSKDRRGMNQLILNHACSDRILYSDDLYRTDIVEELRSMDLDLAILAWWSYIIKPPLLDIPKLGFLNSHPSYLPHHRGKNPNFWALVDQAPFGATLHFIDAGVDSGDIVFQKRIETSWTDTGASLYDKCRAGIIELFHQRFDDILAGNLPRQRLNKEEGSFHYEREMDAASRIHLDKTYTGRELLNLLRARTFPPFPGVRFEDDGRVYEVRVEISLVEDSLNPAARPTGRPHDG